MARAINTVKARQALKLRREPYWHMIRRGCFLGFRKMTVAGEGIFVAKYRESGSAKRLERALGDFAHLPANERFSAALSAANEWLAHVGAGGLNRPITVATACQNYVQNLRDAGRVSTAEDADGRFKRWVYDTVFGNLELGQMTYSKVIAWRNQLKKTPTLPQDKGAKGARHDRSAAALNRDMTALRAALNHARRERHVMTDASWRDALAPEQGANGRRQIALTAVQRKVLLNGAQPTIRPFLYALCLLPLRPGAVAKLAVRDFDRRLNVLRIARDKTGKSREIPVPQELAEFFIEQSKNKLPSAPLFSRGDGKPWNKDSWKHPVREAVMAAGLPEGTTAYTLRHSTITDLLALHDADLLTVARLADTSIPMIQKHYGHLRSGQAIAALEKLAI
jgi:integrase